MQITIKYLKLVILIFLHTLIRILRIYILR